MLSIKLNYNGSSKILKRICLLLNSITDEINGIISNLQVTRYYTIGNKIATIKIPESNPVDIYSPHDLPTGGSTGQFLKKVGDADYGVIWDDIHAIPSGGTTKQVLRKASNVPYDVEWADAEGGGGGGGVSPLYYDTDGYICIDYDLIEQR